MRVRELLKSLSYIFFPKRCRYCGRVIVPSDELCSDCQKELPRISGEICRLCGYAKDDCRCNKKRSYYDAVAAPFYYEGAVKSAVKRMKFKNNPSLCKPMAEDMLEVIEREYANVNFDMICFVPFSPDKLKKREFNQSEILARELSQKLNVKTECALVCLFNVKQQHSLDSFKRKGNVFGIFDVKSETELNGKTVLLVDDIKTTGATLDECAKMLKLHGAEKVYAITFAIAKLHTGGGKTDVDS